MQALILSSAAAGASGLQAAMDLLLVAASAFAAVCILSVSGARLAAALLLAYADAVEAGRRQFSESWRQWTATFVPGLIRRRSHPEETTR